MVLMMLILMALVIWLSVALWRVRRAPGPVPESEMRFRAIFNSNIIGVGTWGPDGELYEVNDAYLKIIHKTREQLNRKEVNWKAITLPEDKPQDDQAVQEILERGYCDSYEKEYLLEDGTRVPALIMGVLLNRNPLMGLALALDITDRKQAEEALTREREQLLSIFNSIDQMIYIADPVTYEILYVNPKLAAQLDEGFMERKCYQAFQGLDAPCPFCTNNIILKQKPAPYRWEFHNTHLDRYFVLVDRIINWPDGREVRFEFAMDITDRKQAEEARVSLERQVQHMQKLESLGVLAGGIAHDFNNLLTAILGHTDLALDSLSPTAPGRENLQEIAQVTRRAADLAKQMLAYSGKGQFVIKPIDIGNLIREMGHLLEVAISKRVVIRYNLEEDLPAFEGDVTQIRQVVMNLITNASESIGDNDGMVALSTGSVYCDRSFLDGAAHLTRTVADGVLPEGMYVYFEVSDTGCGMDAATIAKIFDPFFTTKFTGRGLGMSAVLGIIRGHKGLIRIYSEPGKGTTFKVFFPVGVADEVPGVEMPADTDSEWRGTGGVLLVDDDDWVRDAGRQMLERLGFEVLVATDGLEAVALYREHVDQIICVVLDLTMPHLSGYETFCELRKIKPSVNVILASGYNEQSALEDFEGVELAGFL
ncbi:MAG: PAS domain S-box protein, partial [Spartobacteria bacterium]|nr:PAS domain S-box protein [Spartobacteria bacterium]